MFMKFMISVSCDGNNTVLLCGETSLKLSHDEVNNERQTSRREVKKGFLWNGYTFNKTAKFL